MRAGRVVVAGRDDEHASSALCEQRRRGRSCAAARLGKNFGTNGDLIGAWFKSSGQPSSLRVTTRAGPLHGRVGIGASTLGMAGWGVDSLPLPPAVKRRLSRTVMVFGIGVDSGRASVGFRDGALTVDYDPGSEPVFDDIREAFASWRPRAARRPGPSAAPRPSIPGAARLGALTRRTSGRSPRRGFRQPRVFLSPMLAAGLAAAAVAGLAVARHRGVGASRRGQHRRFPEIGR